MPRPCCSLPTFGISHFEYGSVIKSTDFHVAPVEKLKSTLPYPHRHDFFHVVWIETGHGRHVIDSASYEVRPASLFFMSPSQVHDFELSDDTTGYTINFSSAFFALQLQDKNALSQIPIYNHEERVHALYPEGQDAADIRSLLSSIVHEYEHEEYRYSDLIRSYLFVFLVTASRIAQRARCGESFSYGQLLFRRFSSLLEESFTTKQEASEYARLLGTSERVLNEACRRYAGSTVAQLVRERVILEAKRLLAHSPVQVAEVGAQLGFDDPAYFSRCFKKHTGRTPIEFRSSLARLSG